jgi:hypothetical protein
MDDQRRTITEDEEDTLPGVDPHPDANRDPLTGGQPPQPRPRGARGRRRPRDRTKPRS